MGSDVRIMIEVRITFLRLGDTVDSTFNFPLCLSVGQQQSLLLRTELSVMGRNKALPLICVDLGRLTPGKGQLLRSSSRQQLLVVQMIKNPS